MDILQLGKLCKKVRLKKGIPLVTFAQMNDDNYKNIWAFENGRANNIKYLSYYYNLFEDTQKLEEFLKQVFEIL